MWRISYSGDETFQVPESLDLPGVAKFIKNPQLRKNILVMVRLEASGSLDFGHQRGFVQYSIISSSTALLLSIVAFEVFLALFPYLSCIGSNNKTSIIRKCILVQVSLRARKQLAVEKSLVASRWKHGTVCSREGGYGTGLGTPKIQVGEGTRRLRSRTIGRRAPSRGRMTRDERGTAENDVRMWKNVSGTLGIWRGT